MRLRIKGLIENYRTKKALRRFRRALVPNQKIIVNTGSYSFPAVVYKVMDNYVVIYNNNLQFGAYGKSCIYPAEERS